jgi:exonuclease SbcC
LQASLEEADRAEQAIGEMRASLRPSSRHWTRRRAESSANALAGVQGELAGLGYDTQAHQEASRQIATLAPFEEEARLLAEAEARWDEEMRALVQADEAAQRWAASAEGLSRRLAEIEAGLVELPQLRQTVQEAIQQVASLQVQRDRAQVQLGAALQRLDHLAAMDRRVLQTRVEVKTLQEEQSLYEELARRSPNGCRRPHRAGDTEPGE